MGLPFKRSKKHGVTYTEYQGNKGTTQSRSYKDGATRKTYTHYSSGKIRLTETTTQGGYTVRKSRDLTKGLFNKTKTQKPQKKYKPPRSSSANLNKTWKPNHPRVKWKVSSRKIRSKTIRGPSIPLSFKSLLLLMIFIFSPFFIDIIKLIFT